MILRISFFLIFFLFIKSSYALNLPKEVLQGSLIIGQEPSIDQIMVDNVKTKLSEEGYYVFPVGRDHINPIQVMTFLNNEIKMLKKPLIEMTKTIDTVHLARKLIPGAAASLDALCKRFNIDISKREKHGALLDAQLLAEVYLELTGGRQASLVLEGSEEKSYKKKNN